MKTLEKLYLLGLLIAIVGIFLTWNSGVAVIDFSGRLTCPDSILFSTTTTSQYSITANLKHYGGNPADVVVSIAAPKSDFNLARFDGGGFVCNLPFDFNFSKEKYSATQSKLSQNAQDKVFCFAIKPISTELPQYDKTQLDVTLTCQECKTKQKTYSCNYALSKTENYSKEFTLEKY